MLVKFAAARPELEQQVLHRPAIAGLKLEQQEQVSPQYLTKLKHWLLLGRWVPAFCSLLAIWALYCLVFPILNSSLPLQVLELVASFPLRQIDQSRLALICSVQDCPPNLIRVPFLAPVFFHFIRFILQTDSRVSSRILYVLIPIVLAALSTHLGRWTMRVSNFHAAISRLSQLVVFKFQPQDGAFQVHFMHLGVD